MTDDAHERLCRSAKRLVEDFRHQAPEVWSGAILSALLEAYDAGVQSGLRLSARARGEET